MSGHRKYVLGAGQLLAEGWLAVAGDCLAHLVQCSPGDLLGLLDLLGREVGRVRQVLACQFALERDQRQAVAEQVMQISREAQSLFGDRAARQLRARVPAAVRPRFTGSFP